MNKQYWIEKVKLKSTFGTECYEVTETPQDSEYYTHVVDYKAFKDAVDTLQLIANASPPNALSMKAKQSINRITGEPNG